MNEDYIENTNTIGLIRNEINTNEKFADLFKSRQEARKEARDLKLRLSQQHIKQDTTSNPSSMVSAKNFAGWTSFGYPMLNGETELRPYIIQDAKGAEWTINSKGFYNNDNIEVRVKIKGKEKYITADTAYANTDWIMSMIDFVQPDLKKLFSEKYGFKEIKVFGMNTRATSDTTPAARVYSDDQLPNNDIAGKGLVYNIRFKITWNDGTEVYDDTALMFHFLYLAARERALVGARQVPQDILFNEQEFAVLRQAAEQRIKKLHTTKTL